MVKGTHLAEKISARWRAVLVAVLAVVLLSSGYGIYVLDARADSSVAAQERNYKFVDEMIDQYIMKMQKIEKGQKAFEDLLRARGGKVPAYGTEEYWQRLAEYADPAGNLRRQDPQKWELIEAYAYDYYARNILPPVGPPKREFEQEPSDIQVQSGSYNRSGAVDYAYRYVGNADDNPFWKNYNPAYRYFDGDCTNFVSQCLHEGGRIPEVDAWWRFPWDKDDWYYHRKGTDSFDSNKDDEWSYSWTVVKTLYYHIKSRLGTEVSSPSQLQVGDIVQLNLNTSSSADDHSMIVTKIDSAGNRYVTYHTVNTKDKPLSQISGTKYYLKITY